MNKLTVKRALGALYRPWISAAERKLILVYHSVGGGPLATPLAAFRAQMEFLAKAGCLAPLSTVVDAEAFKPLQVSITFDDGYASVARYALPILASLNAPATVFLNTDMVASVERRRSDRSLGYYPDEEFLTWPEVAHLAELGWTIGSHGVGHLDLTVAGDSAARRELTESRATIERAIGVDCDCFAYTWGHHSERVRRMVGAAGYLSAFAAEHGPIGKNPLRMAIPRMDISRNYGLEDFAAIIRGDWDYLGWVQSRRNVR